MSRVANFQHDEIADLAPSTMRMRDIRDSMSFWRWKVLLAALVLLAGCAGTPEPAADQWSLDESEVTLETDDENDPLEIFNRLTFSINLALDTMVIKPIAATYRFFLPGEVRDSFRNALRNLRSPVVLANDLLQGETDRAGTTAMRFLINSTIGVLGFFDLASSWGYAYHDEDFGQSLAVHGVGEGAYLVLPFFGPSSIRDSVGLLADTFMDPLTYVAQANDAEEALLARTLVAGIDLRSRNIETLEDLQRDSIDFYARIRSLYRQSRVNDINNGRAGANRYSPGLSGDEFEFDIEEDEVEKSQ